MMRLALPVQTALWSIAAFVLLLLYGPLFLAIFFSFFAFRSNRVQWDSFSFTAYARLMDNQRIIDALTNTFVVGAIAVALSLVIGTLLALYHHAERGNKRGRDLLQVVIYLPFLVPPIVTGLSLLIFFRQIDFERSLVTVVIGHTVFVLALVYRNVLARLQTVSRSLVEASLDLGANRWQTFRYVLLPQLMTAFLAAGILAFALSFDETLITLLVTGTNYTLPMELWSMMRLGFTPDINALVALVLAGTTLLCLLATRYLTKP
jgi:putative spermidine/putrescine transport system permease protein/spermidine/putrescine transport system permease protein